MTIQSVHLFPPAALDVLRQARYDVRAKRNYDVWSGGFHWSDELLDEVSTICIREDNFAVRFMLGYRASLSGEHPREEFRPTWEQLCRECPDWPGLRPERYDRSLAAELELEWKRAKKELESGVDVS